MGLHSFANALENGCQDLVNDVTGGGGSAPSPPSPPSGSPPDPTVAVLNEVLDTIGARVSTPPSDPKTYAVTPSATGPIPIPYPNDATFNAVTAMVVALVQLAGRAPSPGGLAGPQSSTGISTDLYGFLDLAKRLHAALPKKVGQKTGPAASEATLQELLRCLQLLQQNARSRRTGKLADLRRLEALLKILDRIDPILMKVKTSKGRTTGSGIIEIERLLRALNTTKTLFRQKAGPGPLYV